MPRGIELFREKFAAHTDKYVLIGGTACELAMQEANLDFRATKDLDIVLTIETLDPVFSTLFWEFVEAGGYEHQRAGTEGKPQCYRFIKPNDATYPHMLELLSRSQGLMHAPAGRPITRIHADGDAASLSAILMDDAYYALVQSHRRIVDGLSTLTAEAIIPLKAKAFLDLTERKGKGDKSVKSDDIRKHKLDVFRLSVLLADTTRVPLADTVRADLQKFMTAMVGEEIATKALGLGNRTKGQILTALTAIYRV